MIKALQNNIEISADKIDEKPTTVYMKATNIKLLVTMV